MHFTRILCEQPRTIDECYFERKIRFDNWNPLHINNQNIIVIQFQMKERPNYSIDSS